MGKKVQPTGPKPDPTDVYRPTELQVREGISPEVAAELFKRAMESRGIAHGAVLFARMGVTPDKAKGWDKGETAIAVWGEIIQAAFCAGLESGYAMGREVFGGDKK